MVLFAFCMCDHDSCIGSIKLSSRGPEMISVNKIMHRYFQNIIFKINPPQIHHIQSCILFFLSEIDAIFLTVQTFLISVHYLASLTDTPCNMNKSSVQISCIMTMRVPNLTMFNYPIFSVLWIQNHFFTFGGSKI